MFQTGIFLRSLFLYSCFLSLTRSSRIFFLISACVSVKGYSRLASPVIRALWELDPWIEFQCQPECQRWHRDPNTFGWGYEPGLPVGTCWDELSDALIEQPLFASWNEGAGDLVRLSQSDSVPSHAGQLLKSFGWTDDC